MEVQISESGNKLPQFVAAFAACLGAFAQGTALSWTSPALPHISDCTKDCDFNFNATTGSWIGSIFTLGALSSSFVAAYLMGAIGRKKTLIIMAAPFIVGWLLLLLPVPLKMNENVSKWMFLVGRYLTGK
jgi:MFS family permease